MALYAIELIGRVERTGIEPICTALQAVARTFFAIAPYVLVFPSCQPEHVPLGDAYHFQDVVVLGFASLIIFTNQYQ